MGDFTGFTFGDWHSSDPQVGDIVVRVSGGDRYEEQLQPEVKDRTAEVPGRDGEYYFGSDYGPRTIDVEIAFDHLTEEQFRRLRQVFGTKRIKELIFDERPYKKYMAKIESPVELSYICFDEPKRHIDTSGNARGVRWIEETHTETVIDEEAGEPTDETVEVTERVRETIYPYVRDEGTERIYKGEGKISFKCYFPFAKSVFKQLPFTYQLTQDEDIIEGKKYFILENTTYSVVTEPNVADIEEYYERVVSKESEAWAISSGILSIDEYENIDKYDSQTGIINVYNAGDIETGFRLYLPGAQNSEVSINYKENGLQKTASLILKPFELKVGDAGVLVDTTNNLIIGVESQKIMIDGQQQDVGITYDEDGNAIYKTSGNLYNKYIEMGYFFHLQPNVRYDESILEIENGTEGIEIFYDYLYF